MHMRGFFEQGVRKKWEQSERMRFEAQCVCVCVCGRGGGLGGEPGKGE